MLQAELETYSLKIDLKVRTLNYWLSIVNGKHSKLNWEELETCKGRVYGNFNTDNLISLTYHWHDVQAIDAINNSVN